MLTLSVADLSRFGEQVGLLPLSVLSTAVVENRTAGELRFLAEWQQQGFAGEMKYMLRDVSLFSRLANFLPEVRTVVSFFVSYNHGNFPAIEQGWGRVARYAWGQDYHMVLRRRVQELVNTLCDSGLLQKDKLCTRIFSDAVPLLERAIASEGRLGFVGKNTMVIRPGYGSFGFLLELLWNVEIEGESQNKPVRPSGGKLKILHDGQHAGEGCGSCARCMSDCPTAAFVAPGVLNANRCISYLTIEKKTAFSDWESQALGDWVFGCDGCQETCPFNHQGVERSVWDEFSSAVGVGPFLELCSVLKLRTKSDFQKRFKGTALMRAGRAALVRNACSVIENQKFLPAIKELIAVSGEDESTFVRVHAKKVLSSLYEVAYGSERRRIAVLLSR